MGATSLNKNAHSLAPRAKILLLAGVVVVIGAVMLIWAPNSRKDSKPASPRPVAAAAPDTEQAARIAERLKAFRVAAEYSLSQTRKLLSVIEPCDGDLSILGNRDFEPSLPFAVSEATDAQQSYRLARSKASLIQFIDLENESPPFIEATVHDGALKLNIPSPGLERPQLRDGVFILKIRDRLCRSQARLSFVPKPANESQFEIVNIIGRRGTDLGRFTLPYGSDFRPDNGHLLISDCVNAIIQEFNLRGDLVNWFGGHGDGPGHLRLPADVKFHRGRIYVVEEGNHRIQVFDPAGTSIQRIGALSKELATTEDQAGSFNNPLGIAIDALGEQIVVDYGNDRIQKIGARGAAVISANRPGDTYKLVGPYYVEIDARDQHILITNRGANEIVVLAPDGTKLSRFGGGVLNYPHELAIADDGSIYVADMKNHRLAIFEERSNRKISFLDFPSTWGHPKTVAVNKNGLLAVGFSGGPEAFVALLTKSRNFSKSSLSSRMGTAAPAHTRSSSEFPSANIAGKYERYCSYCHEHGNFKAPKRGDEDDWARFPRSVDMLMSLVMSGQGAMIPRGGCDECSVEDLRALIQLLVPERWSLR